MMENVPLQDLLWRVCLRRKLWLAQMTGDTTYGTTDNIVALEDAGIRAFFALPDFDDRTPIFGRNAFTYDAEAATCNACAIKASCTQSDQGRIVHRSFYADYLETMRDYHATAAYQKAMRKRQVWAEPLFAEAKAWHGLCCFRLRGLGNVNIAGLLVAAGQNLKRFLAATGWGKRHAPCGSLVALPRALRPLAATSC